MKEMTISASHQLLYHEGKCANKHGHNYRIQVYAKGVPDERTGMVLDFAEMELAMEATIGLLDHRDLNPFVGQHGSPAGTLGTLASYLGGFAGQEDWQETTAENLAFAWLYDLSKLNDKFCGIRVWETATCFAQVGQVQAIG